MGRAAERFPERAREMRRRDTDFSGERFDRQARVVRDEVVEDGAPEPSHPLILVSLRRI